MPGAVDSWRPNFESGGSPPRMPAALRDSMFALEGVDRRPNQGRNYNARQRPRETNRHRDRRSDRPRFSYPRGASFRPLLRQQPNTDEQVLRDTSAADKFRNVDELTDSEEDDMLESADEDNDDAESRPVKKAKTINTESPVAATSPKWCNPDPYTSLPPEMENIGKRTDVLKLIRKAKLAHEREKVGEAEAQDFISFADLDDDSPVSSPASMPENPFARGFQADGPAGEQLGKRKRGQDDAVPRPPGGYLPPDKLVLAKWIALDNSRATPWLKQCAPLDSPGTA
jgi:non-canonical poly(A) RNA polymerase PAPD5/7